MVSSRRLGTAVEFAFWQWKDDTAKENVSRWAYCVTWFNRFVAGSERIKANSRRRPISERECAIRHWMQQALNRSWIYWQVHVRLHKLDLEAAARLRAGLLSAAMCCWMRHTKERALAVQVRVTRHYANSGLCKAWRSWHRHMRELEFMSHSITNLPVGAAMQTMIEYVEQASRMWRMNRIAVAHLWFGGRLQLVSAAARLLRVDEADALASWAAAVHRKVTSSGVVTGAVRKWANRGLQQCFRRWSSCRSSQSLQLARGRAKAVHRELLSGGGGTFSPVAVYEKILPSPSPKKGVARS